jgi:hypothetical protein
MAEGRRGPDGGEVASGGKGLSPAEGDGAVILAPVRVIAGVLLGEAEATVA